MNKAVLNKILTATKADEITDIYEIQTLWSGYGHLYRIELDGGISDTVIAKHITFLQDLKSANNRSHARKLKSYHIEME